MDQLCCVVIPVKSVKVEDREEVEEQEGDGQNVNERRKREYRGKNVGDFNVSLDFVGLSSPRDASNQTSHLGLPSC